ncbi:hypothetical protein V8D89_002806 [Ganoderma adspersum]
MYVGVFLVTCNHPSYYTKRRVRGRVRNAVEVFGFPAITGSCAHLEGFHRAVAWTDPTWVILSNTLRFWHLGSPGHHGGSGVRPRITAFIAGARVFHHSERQRCPPSHLTNGGSLRGAAFGDVLHHRTFQYIGRPKRFIWRFSRTSLHAFRSLAAYCQTAHGATCAVSFYMSRMLRIVVMTLLLSRNIGNNCLQLNRWNWEPSHHGSLLLPHTSSMALLTPNCPLPSRIVPTREEYCHPSSPLS